MKMKHEKVILVALLLFTPLVLLGLQQTHPTFEIGIVLVDETDDHYAGVIIRGFIRYDEYFEARLLPVSFNASGVEFERDSFGYEHYLNSDLVEKAAPLELAGAHEVDIILLLTDHFMSDWDGDNTSIWGQAFPDHSCVLMSSAWFDDNDTGTDRGAQQIALHETMHLLGYTHNMAYQHGIMGYGDYSSVKRVPLPFERFQMPLRAHLFALVGATSFVNIVTLTRVAWALLLLPPYAAVELLVYRRYRDRQPEAEHHTTMAIASLIGSFTLLAIFVESFAVLMAPLAVIVGVHEGYARYLSKHKRSLEGKSDDS